MMTTTPRLHLPYILQSQSQKEVTHNEALDIIDVLLQAAVNSVGLNSPQPSPTLGDSYVLGSAPEGAWVGHANALAFYTHGWNFISPWEGLTLWAKDVDALVTYNGSSWVQRVNQTPSQNITMLGVNSAADHTNKFTVASAAILFNHIGKDMQVKINKNALNNKASFLFQTGFSGRAEFGLLGDDNFTLKVSPDGSTFYESLKMLSGSGRAALKSNAAGLTASGATQSTATPITKQTNEFTEVGAGQGALLPSPEQGDFIFVANAGINTLNVYPIIGHRINALAPNAAFSLAAGKNAMFWAATSTKWYANLSG